mgnify:CR=1 FL=1
MRSCCGQHRKREARRGRGGGGGEVAEIEERGEILVPYSAVDALYGVRGHLCDLLQGEALRQLWAELP